MNKSSKGHPLDSVLFRFIFYTLQFSMGSVIQKNSCKARKIRTSQRLILKSSRFTVSSLVRKRSAVQIR